MRRQHLSGFHRMSKGILQLSQRWRVHAMTVAFQTSLSCSIHFKVFNLKSASPVNPNSVLFFFFFCHLMIAVKHREKSFTDNLSAPTRQIKPLLPVWTAFKRAARSVAWPTFTCKGFSMLHSLLPWRGISRRIMPMYWRSADLNTEGHINTDY